MSLTSFVNSNSKEFERRVGDPTESKMGRYFSLGFVKGLGFFRALRGGGERAQSHRFTFSYCNRKPGS
jgi:hypothetical protein